MIAKDRMAYDHCACA